MSKISDYLEQKGLDHVFNGITLTPPATVYLALFTTDPTDDGSGTEVSGGSYARQRIYADGAGSPAFALAAVDGDGYSVQNAAVVNFPTATAAWGTITHVGLFDALTGGNLLWHGPLTEPQVIGNGGHFAVDVGYLTIKLE